MRVILTPLASRCTLALSFLPKKGQLVIEAKGSHTCCLYIVNILGYMQIVLLHNLFIVTVTYTSIIV